MMDWLKELKIIAGLLGAEPFCRLAWGEKRPSGNKWGDRPFPLATIERIATHERFGVGFHFDPALSDIAAFDLDSPKSYEHFRDIFGCDPDDIATMQSSSGKDIGGGLLSRQVYFRLSSGDVDKVAGRTTIGNNELDLRRGYQIQSVLPTDSPHPGTGEPYRWIFPPSSVGIATLSPDAINRFFELRGDAGRNSKEPSKNGKETSKTGKGLDDWLQEIDDRHKQFRAGEITLNDLRPAEVVDFVIAENLHPEQLFSDPRHDWKLSRGRVVGHPVYRESSSGTSLERKTYITPSGLEVYRAYDWGGVGLLSVIDLNLRLAGIADPSGEDRGEEVRRIAEKHGIDIKYEPVMPCGEWTDEQRREWVQQRIEGIKNEHETLAKTPETCDFFEVDSFEAAIAIARKPEHKVVVVTGAKGAGKSSVIQGLLSAGVDTLSIATTRALSHEQSRKYGLGNYLREGDMSPSAIKRNGGLVISWDSLPKLPYGWQPALVTVDELDSGINHVNSARTALAKNRNEVRYTFENVVKKTLENNGKFLGLSADIGGGEIDFIHRLFGVRPTVIKVTVPPRGSNLILCEDQEAMFGMMLEDWENRVADWLDVGKFGHAPFMSIITDSRRKTDQVGVQFCGEYEPVKKHGNSDDYKYWEDLSRSIVSKLDKDIAELTEIIIVNSHTAGDSEIKDFIADPSASLLQKSATGKAIILIMSPTVREGVSVVYPHPHNSYVFQHGVLSVRSAAQQIKRDRNPDNVFLWVSPRVQNSQTKLETIAEMKENLLTKMECLKGDKSFIDEARKFANYLRFKNEFFLRTMKPIHEAADDDIWQFARSLVDNPITGLSAGDAIDGLSVYAECESPWLLYALYRQQEDAINRMDYQESLINHLIEKDGFTQRETISADTAPSIDKDEMKAAREATISMDARWFFEGWGDDSYESEKQCREILGSDKNIHQREYYQVSGALFRFKYPGFILSESFAEEIVAKPKKLSGVRALWACKNPDKTKVRGARGIAAEFSDTYKSHSIGTDIGFTADEMLLADVVRDCGFLDLLDAGAYTQESEAVDRIIKRVQQHRKQIKALRIVLPKTGQHDKYLRFINSIANRLGLRQEKSHQQLSTLAKTPTIINAYRMFLAPETPALLEALDAYTANKESALAGEVAAAKSVKQHLSFIYKKKTSAVSPETASGTTIQPILPAVLEPHTGDADCTANVLQSEVAETPETTPGDTHPRISSRHEWRVGDTAVFTDVRSLRNGKLCRVTGGTDAYIRVAFADGSTAAPDPHPRKDGGSYISYPSSSK